MSTQESIFYKEAFLRRFPVSLMALECFFFERTKVSSDEDVVACALEVVEKYCKVPSPTKKDLDYFFERLVLLKKEVDEERPSEGGKPAKTFGSAYREYINEVPLDVLLLRMVDYNMSLGAELYCDKDRDDVVLLLDDYVKEKHEYHTVLMEASMYGFGGHYKGDSKDKKAKGVDIASKEGEAALRSLGF